MTDTTAKPGTTDDESPTTAEATTDQADPSVEADADADAEAADPDAATGTGAADSDDDVDEASTDGAAEVGSGPDPRLLEELDEHIRAARAAAEETLGNHEHTFVESGDQQSEDQDDQTIAPPG